MWMHIEHIGLSEINQRQTLYFITYVWSLKNKANEYEKMETGSQIQRTSGYQWEKGRGRCNIGRRN